MIAVESRRRTLAKLSSQYPGCEIMDLTSKAPEPWIRFSPFYPHGGIPIPFSADRSAESVEGIWQGLKVFESEGVDIAKLHVTSMRGIKRSVRTRGRVLGHQKGLDSTALLGYLEARRSIYLPSYRYVLDERLQPEIEKLSTMADATGIVLLDYETNTDVNDTRRPLSHASLVRAYLEDDWPSADG